MRHSYRGRFTLLVAAALGATLALPSAAGAATKPCKLLKRSEIAKTFDQEVGKPKKGIVPSSVGGDCTWDVEETDTKPSGLVATFVQKVGAKTAFNENKKTYEEQGQVQEVSGLGKAFYQSSGLASSGDGVVWMLKGSVLITVQGAFFSLGDDPEVDPAELKEELVELAKIAKKRY
jgi:hypothetical protein